MEKEKPLWSGLLLRALLVVAFIASWLALIALLLRTIERLWPAMTVSDPASLVAGALLIPMAAFLIQAVVHLPRSRRRAVFLRARILTRFSIILLPVFKRLEDGPALDLLATPADRAVIRAEAERRMKIKFSLIPRLALLLDNRSPLEVLLARLMASRARPLSALGWLLFLVVGPARQFTRLWGYVFTRLWIDPGPEGELVSYKRKVAFDLLNRAIPFRIDTMDYEGARRLLAGIWKELKRVHNNPRYGQDLGEPLPQEPPEDEGGGENDTVAAAFNAPWLDPRYYGVYLNLSVTLAARTAEELYDSWRDDDVSLFYPPELGQEVEAASWLLAERTRLTERLAERAEEGIVQMDGRPVPTWTINSWLFDIEGDLNYYKQRVAAHHRRCRTAHLTRARRLARGWPEYLRGTAGALHFAEHARRALTTARTGFEKLMKRPEKTHGETLAEATRLHGLMADLHDRLIRLDLPGELEVRPADMLPLALISPVIDLGDWLAAWAPEHQRLTDLFSALREKALTALLWGEDQVAGRGQAPGGEPGPAPPAPGLIPDFVSIRPPVEVPERVYSMADRLKIGFGHSVLAALVLALLLWQSQTLGRTRLVVYNGLGRDVTVWVGDSQARVRPYDRALLDLQPGQVYDVVAGTGDLPLERYRRALSDQSPTEALAARSHLIERFTRRLAPKPGTEVYNIAGAAPLMLWWSPSKPEGADASERFLGRPVWLDTEADVLFRAPSPNAEKPQLVLSGYGELAPSEMLPSFPSARDQGELIYLHALWDNPGASGFRQWQVMAFSQAQAEILIRRLAREPDFLEKCVRQLELVGIQ